MLQIMISTLDQYDSVVAIARPDHICIRSWCAHRLYCLPCRVTVNDMLAQADLGHFFQAFVTAEDGMDTISQRFLSASIKLGRPPNQCVVFESSPAGITAAHNCTMKVSCIFTISIPAGTQVK